MYHLYRLYLQLQANLYLCFAFFLLLQYVYDVTVC